MYHCLIVEDEIISQSILKKELKQKGYLIDGAQSFTEAIAFCARRIYDIALIDIRLPDGSGIDVLRRVKEKNRSAIVIMITASTRIDDAVRSMKLGANDYITKPYDIMDLQKRLEQMLDTPYFRNRQDPQEDSQPLLDKDTTQLIQKIKDIATTVLITGESGTGKGVIAREIHRLGSRANKPFVHVNCAAIQPGLIESELFGHEKGAFTGAISTKKGKFEMAGDGTIFLDEVGTMPLELQAKLLTVLQDRYFERVGGVERINVHARIISATNADLEDQVNNKEFREDLYYRLNVIRIELLPLRFRKNDIRLLTERFIRMAQQSTGNEITEVSEEFWQTVLSYDWPGNIRELENAIEAAVVLTDGHVLRPDTLPLSLSKKAADPRTLFISDRDKDKMEYRTAMETEEANLIRNALYACSGHREKTAEYLGISRRALQYKLKKYNLLNLDF